jgi:hypothetical protein
MRRKNPTFDNLAKSNEMREDAVPRTDWHARKAEATRDRRFGDKTDPKCCLANKPVLFGSSPHRDIKSFSPKQGLFGSLI